MKLTGKVKNILLTLGLMASTFGCLISSTLAWITTSNKVSVGDASGYTQGAYFARGRGTSDDPYILNAPVHLYNLAWLQYLGKFDDQVFYFKMESDLELNGTEYQKLPPIGTQEHPFIGNFDGDGYTISGLTTCNKLGDGENEILRKPSTVTSNDFKPNALGLFGYVESYDETSKIQDFNIRNYTVVSATKDVLVGAVAGYLDGNVSGVKVSNEDEGVTFNIGNLSSTSTGYDDLTEYGLVGHATNKCLSTISEDSIQIYNPYISDGESSDGSSGNDTLWGGSFTAKSLSSRFTTIKGDTTNQEELKWQNNLKQRTAYYDSDGNMVDGTESLEYYTDDELGSDLTQWSNNSDPLKGKTTFGSGNEPLGGSVDRPKERGYKDIKFVLGGGDAGGSSEDGDNEGGGGGEGEGSQAGTDAIDPNDPYVPPTPKTGSDILYLVAGNYSFSTTSDVNNASTFDRDDGYYLTYTQNGTTFTFGVWHVSHLKDGADLVYNAAGNIPQVIQDRGKYIRMADADNPRNGQPYYVRYAGGKFVLTDKPKAANVVYIDGHIRIDTSIAESRMVPTLTQSSPNTNYFNQSQFGGRFGNTTFRAATVAVVRYLQANTAGPWEHPPKVVDNRAKAAPAFADANGYVYYMYGNTALYPIYWNPPGEGEAPRGNESTNGYIFKVMNDGTLMLYHNGSPYVNSQGKNGYLYCTGTTFAVTYDSSKAKATLSEERIRGVIDVDPSSLGDDAWVQRTYARKHDEKIGATYLPLNVYETSTIPTEDASFWSGNSITPSQYYPKPTNTGYVVGGTKGYDYDKDTDTITYQSAYEFNATNLFGGDSFAVKTRTASSNGFATINDGNVGTLGLERYTSSKNELTGNTSNFFRFTGGEVGSDNVVSADSVLFNKHIYSDYELPESTLDFQVENKGVFNMFASSSAGNNACTGFASFYQIFRGEVTRGEGDNETVVSNGVSEIRRISKIYTNPADEAIVYEYYDVDGYYKYNAANNSYAETASITGYNVAFDMTWIESFNGSTGGCYYFEWPVCPGEYALGAVPTASVPEDETPTPIDHGFICYVGVGAPAAVIPGIQIFEKFIQTTKTYSVIEGIYFVESVDVTPTIDDRLTFVIESGFTGNITIESGGEGTTIIDGFDEDSMDLVFKKYEMVVKKAGEDPPEDALGVTPSSTSTKITERVHAFNTAANGTVIERTAEIITIDGVEQGLTGSENLNPHTSHFTSDTPMIMFHYVYLTDSVISLTVGIESTESGETYTVTKINVSIDPDSPVDVKFTRIDDDAFDVYVNGTKVATINTPIEIQAA